MVQAPKRQGITIRRKKISRIGFVKQDMISIFDNIRLLKKDTIFKINAFALQSYQGVTQYP